MAVLDIARMGNPILRRRAAEVPDPTAPEIRRLVSDMLETMEYDQILQIVEIEKKIVDTYPVAFRLPPPDVSYIKRMWKMKTTRTEALLFRASAIQTLLKKGDSKGVTSAKNIIWLQLKDMGMEESFFNSSSCSSYYSTCS